MLPCQDIPPQKPSQRGTERRTESTVVHTKSHTVHGSPESAIGYGDAIFLVDLDPSLDNTGKEDCGSDIRSGELGQTLVVLEREMRAGVSQLTLQRITDRNPIPPIAPTVPVLLTQ